MTEVRRIGDEPGAAQRPDNAGPAPRPVHVGIGRIDHAATMSGLTVRRVADASPEDVSAAFAAAFAGYQVPIAMTAAQHDLRFRSEDGDPFASNLFLFEDEPVAILLINRRGWGGRVGAMGIAPARRGTGLGAEIIRRAVDEATLRGDERLTLEVIESNVRAVRLYASAGFEVVRPLWGFAIDARSSAQSPDAMPVREIDPAEGAWRTGGFGMAELPWQLQVPTLAAMVRPTRCFTSAAGSIVAMADASQHTVRLRAIAFDPRLSADEAATFTMSLSAVFPGRAWSAPPIFTDAHRTRFFTPAGWATIEMRQLEMRHLLGAAGRLMKDHGR